VPIQERNLSTIELKEDNANAMERVLLNIYQDIQPITAQLAQSWRYWLNVYVVADKYLEPKSIDQALTCVRTTIQSLENIDEIFNLYEALVTEMTHYDVFVELAAQLQRSHLDRLLDCDRFCRHVENDKDAMWKIVKSLRIARDEALRPKARPGALELELPNPLNLNYLNHLNHLNNFVQPRQSIRDPPRLKR
jgi:hypothetical protein